MGKLSGAGLPHRLGRQSARLQAPGGQDGWARRSKDWLNTARWQRLRKKVLLRDRYVCQQTGVLLIGKSPAPDSPIVDHKVPHRGDPELFWDEDNLQSVSKAWHDSVKQSREKCGEV